jgi:hypothetical protein
VAQLAAIKLSVREQRLQRLHHLKQLRAQEQLPINGSAVQTAAAAGATLAALI